MRNVLTEAVLIESLENIKNSLRRVRGGEAGNIAFLNLNSFYNYIDACQPHTVNSKYQDSDRNDIDGVDNNNGNVSTFQDMVAKVAPYIPLSISDDNLKRFLEATISNDAALIRALELEFVENAKARFLNSIFTADDNDDEWEEIVRVCKVIREYKENSALLPM